MKKGLSQQNKQSAKIKLLCERATKASHLLHSVYGSPHHGNKKNPLDELIFIILSLMTTHHSFNRVYTHLKKQVRSWAYINILSVEELREIIKEGGLSDQKARRIKKITQRIYEDFGKVTLAPLKFMETNTAERYLVSLPGVGVKTAKCILMYSLNRQVLPVDTHVWRLAKRLELIEQGLSYSKVHDEIERIVRPEDRYSFHVNALCHGREICQALKPKCNVCILKEICPYPKRRAIKVSKKNS